MSRINNVHLILTVLFLLVFNACDKTNKKQVFQNEFRVGDLVLGESIKENPLCNKVKAHRDGNTYCKLTDPAIRIFGDNPVHLGLVYNFRGNLESITAIITTTNEDSFKRY